jgi:hypothetical protein
VEHHHPSIGGAPVLVSRAGDLDLVVTGSVTILRLDGVAEAPSPSQPAP